MKKVAIIVLISVLAIWFIFSSIYTISFLRKGYVKVTVELEEQKRQEFLRLMTINYTDNFDPTSSISQRFEMCNNSVVLEYLKTFDRSSLVAYPKMINNDLLAGKLDSLIQQWPKSVRDFASENIVKIVYISNLGSTARAVKLLDGEYIIFIDQYKASLPPNDWFNLVESQCTSYDEKTYRIDNIVEINNEIEYTIENILLHEVGHCYGDYYGYARRIDEGWKFDTSSTLNLYSNLFEIKYVEISSLREVSISNNNKYYDCDKKAYSIEDYISSLDEMTEYGFPTRYSTKNDQEYFAEMFYSYIHCLVQNRPFKYRVYKNGKIFKEVNNGLISATKNQDKIKILKKIIY